MDALEILRQMHGDAKNAFQGIERATPDERGRLWAKLRPELILHEQLEERFVYEPVAREVGSRDAALTQWERQHHEEVSSAESLIDRIGRTEPRDARWMSSVMELLATLEHHISTEEREIWPRIRQVWGEQKLDDAGTKVSAARAARSAGSAISGAVGQAGEVITETARGIRGAGDRQEPAA